MAIWLRWAAVVVAACAGVTLLVFGPLDPGAPDTGPAPLLDEDGSVNHAHPLSVRMNDLNEEISRERLRHFEAQAEPQVLAALPPRPAAVLRMGANEFPSDAPEGMDSARFARAMRQIADARADLQSLVDGWNDSTKVRVAVVRTTADETHYWHEDYARYFAGADSAGAYCAVGYSDLNELLWERQVLGPCRYWVRYGAPSPAVMSWFSGAGHLLNFDRILTERDTDARRKLFGIRAGTAYSEPSLGPLMEGCLAGRDDVCVDAARDMRQFGLLIAGHVEDSRTIHTRPRWIGPGYLVAGGLVSDIEREVGPERFARIWTSSTDPEADLSAALGVDFDEWLMDWAGFYFGVEPIGPRPDTETSVRSLLFILAVLGTGLWIASRRQVG